MSPNTVLISSLPREYTQEELAKFPGACDDSEVALFSTFLLTGFREQEVTADEWKCFHVPLPDRQSRAEYAASLQGGRRTSDP
jgi:hypothetical protein